MLTFLGFAMVITFMFLIMTKRLSALIALIIIYGGIVFVIGLTGLTIRFSAEQEAKAKAEFEASAAVAA